MEPQSDFNSTNMDNMHKNWEGAYRRGKVFGGILLVIIGLLFLARQMGVILPLWLFTWKMLLIVIGVYVGVKHAFRGFGWMIPIFIGFAFLVEDFFPGLYLGNFIWPLAFILIGLSMIFRPRKYFGSGAWHRKFERERWKHHRGNYGGYNETQNTDDDYMEIDTVFGSVNKNIISKDFKGGGINTVFGSAKINLSQADINGTVVLEINNVFGGTQLIIPAHWELKSELTAVMGGVEDKRAMYKDRTFSEGKLLILKGAAVFGGIEIMSF